MKICSFEFAGSRCDHRRSDDSPGLTRTQTGRPESIMRVRGQYTSVSFCGGRVSGTAAFVEFICGVSSSRVSVPQGPPSHSFDQFHEMSELFKVLMGPSE
jgi:hypothetical protein